MHRLEREHARKYGDFSSDSFSAHMFISRLCGWSSRLTSCKNQNNCYNSAFLVLSQFRTFRVIVLCISEWLLERLSESWFPSNSETFVNSSQVETRFGKICRNLEFVETLSRTARCWVHPRCCSSRRRTGQHCEQRRKERALPWIARRRCGTPDDVTFYSRLQMFASLKTKIWCIWCKASMYGKSSKSMCRNPGSPAISWKCCPKFGLKLNELV